jgi:hypothetical protein
MNEFRVRGKHLPWIDGGFIHLSLFTLLNGGMS